MECAKSTAANDVSWVLTSSITYDARISLANATVSISAVGEPETKLESKFGDLVTDADYAKHSVVKQARQQCSVATDSLSSKVTHLTLATTTPSQPNLAASLTAKQSWQ